jgi:hypothetical protein
MAGEGKPRATNTLIRFVLVMFNPKTCALSATALVDRPSREDMSWSSRRVGTRPLS